MPKLLQIDSCLGIGSTGQITESIGNLAVKKGWECYIAHGARYVGSTHLNSIPVVTKFEEYLHIIKSVLFDNHGLNSVRETKKLIRLINTLNPDIIHLHCIHGYYLNYTVLFEYLNRKDIPIVWTFHDCWAFTGHCAHFERVNCIRWKEEGCHDCPLIGDYPKAIIDRSNQNFLLKKKFFTTNKNLHIVTVSEWLASVTRLSFFGNNDIRVISNGIDIKRFSPTRDVHFSFFSNSAFVILGVASQWKVGKGLEHYLELSEMLSDDEVIVLIGVNKKIKTSLPKKIIGIERISDQNELATYYSKANVVISLSDAETFGLTIVEAMACGTPVVVYKNTAQPEIVTNRTGFIVENGNVKEVYKAIKEIKNKGKLFYSDNCRRRVIEKYDKDNCYMNYMSLYESLVSK